MKSRSVEFLVGANKTQEADGITWANVGLAEMPEDSRRVHMTPARQVAMAMPAGKAEEKREPELAGTCNAHGVSVRNLLHTQCA